MALRKRVAVPAKVTTKGPGGIGVLTTKQTFEHFDNAYIKVATVNGTKEMIEAVVETDLGNGSILKDSVFFVPNLNGTNFIKQAYEHMKTMPDYADAEDV